MIKIIFSSIFASAFNSPEWPNNKEEVDPDSSIEKTNDEGGNHQREEGAEDVENIKDKSDGGQDNPGHQESWATLSNGRSDVRLETKDPYFDCPVDESRSNEDVEGGYQQEQSKANVHN